MPPFYMLLVFAQDCIIQIKSEKINDLFLQLKMNIAKKTSKSLKFLIFTDSYISILFNYFF